MVYRYHQGDAVEFARGYTGPLFHALFCDAPYEMDFMNHEWDGSGVAFDPDTWRAFARVLYPGAFLFVFAGTINDDLISVAMREAGLRKFHKMMGWAYGSGFPKASRVDTQIDKREKGGAHYKNGKIYAARNDEIRHVCRFLRSKMEELGKTSKDIASHFGFNSRMVDHWAARETDSQPSVPTWEQWKELKILLSFNGEMDSEVKRLNERKGTLGDLTYEGEVVGKSENGIAGGTHEHAGQSGAWGFNGEYDLTKPATPLSQAFAGHRYGLQALKPAIETILIFQKPYDGKPIDNITETGAGALNIDGGRIEGSVESGWNKTKGNGDKFIGNTYNNGESYPESQDKFSPHVLGRWPSNFILLDEGAAQALDEQSGKGDKIVLNDSGGASRFFFRVSEQIDEADPVRYVAKASRGEREAGLEGMSETEIGHNRFDTCGNCGGYLLQNPDRPSACKCENPERKNNRMKNPHPTVKPIELSRYLATLLLPPVEYAPRRLFVPFAGVASEMIGAILAGWEEIEGVELTKKYIPIGEARLAYWQKKPRGSRKPKSSIPLQAKDPRQLEFK